MYIVDTNDVRKKNLGYLSNNKHRGITNNSIFYRRLLLRSHLCL